MPLVVKDRVQETSTTTGTGTFTLAGAVSGFQSFSVIGNANTTYYAIVMGSEWEVGLGTYTSSGTTLSRDTVLESSNSGSLVNFSAGTKNVFVTYPAEKSVYLDNSDKLNVNANGLTFNDNTTQNTSAYGGGFAMRNRIINGDMRIDQRNAGASYSVTAGLFGYVSLDRYRVNNSTDGAFTLQQSTTAPTGFSNSLIATVTTTDTSIAAGQFAILQQNIEGFNVADLGFGTAGASTITLSFWVRSSITGTFTGALLNSATNRSYPFSYTINSANTFELKTITVVGDTTGTWLTNNGTGLTVIFALACGSTFTGTAGSWAGATYLGATGQTNLLGTNGATFYITGVQLEKGSTATSFDYRPYSAELAMCQRYYYRIKASGTNYSMFGPSWNENTTRATGQIKFPVTMRTRPTALEQTGTASNYSILHGTTATTCSSVPAYEAYTNADIGVCFYTVSSGLTAGQGSALADSNGTSAYLGWSAEL